MKIKKILAVLLALAMLMSFAACGDNDKEDVKGSIALGDLDEDDVLSEDDEDEDKDKDEKDDDEDEEEDEEEDEKKDDDFEIGKTKSGKYENEFIGIGCKIPSGWESYSEEKIAELNNIVLDTMGEDCVEAMKELDYFYDMYTASKDGRSSINVIFEKHSKSVIASTNLEDTAEKVVKQVKQTYENYGLTKFESEIEDVKIDGKKFTSYRLVSEINGVEIYQMGIMLKKAEYLVSISITAASEEELDELFDGFYLL